MTIFAIVTIGGYTVKSLKWIAVTGVVLACAAAIGYWQKDTKAPMNETQHVEEAKATARQFYMKEELVKDLTRKLLLV